MKRVLLICMGMFLLGLCSCNDDMTGEASTTGSETGEPISCVRLLEVYPNIPGAADDADHPKLRYIVVSGVDCDRDTPAAVGWSSRPNSGWEVVELDVPAGDCVIVGAELSDNRNANPVSDIPTSWGEPPIADSWAVSLWQQNLPVDGVQYGPDNWPEPHLFDFSDDPSPSLPIHKATDWELQIDATPNICE